MLPTHTWTLAHPESERGREESGGGAHNRCMPHCGTVRHACKHYHFWLKTRQLPEGHDAVQAAERGGAGGGAAAGWPVFIIELQSGSKSNRIIECTPLSI